MRRPSRDTILMGTADLYAMRSTCSRASVGAVIAVEGRILSTGYNGPPSGFDHCQHEENEELPEGCIEAVHAEANAIAFAAKHGVKTDGAELFCTFMPCPTCAKLIINAGIKRVVYRIAYRKDDGVGMLQRADVDVQRFEGVE